jgi:hypothetical protein
MSNVYYIELCTTVHHGFVHNSMSNVHCTVCIECPSGFVEIDVRASMHMWQMYMNMSDRNFVGGSKSMEIAQGCRYLT